MGTGTGFVNYQQLMDLNKDQAGDYAQRVYNQLNGQGQQAQGEVAAANNYDPYVTRAYQGKVPVTAGTGSYSGQNIVSEPLYNSAATASATDANGNVLGTNQASIVGGPANQTADPSKQPTGASVNQFESSFGQASDPSRLGSYLRQQKDPGSYTSGMASLDASLISPKVNTSSLANRYSSLMDQWNTAQQGMSDRLNSTPSNFNVSAPKSVYVKQPTYAGDTQQQNFTPSLWGDFKNTSHQPSVADQMASNMNSPEKPGSSFIDQWMASLNKKKGQ